MNLTENEEEPARLPPVAQKPVESITQDEFEETMNQKYTQDSFSMNKTAREPIHKRLYEQAKFKEAKLHEYERIKHSNDLSHCTFTPKVQRQSSRSRSSNARFEELARNDKNAKEEMYKMRREAKEIEGCTFQPNINMTNASKNMTMQDNTIFDRLYQDNQVRKKYKRNLEVDRQSFSATQSLANTSFSSNIPKRPNKQVFEKLYKDHEHLKRKKVKMELNKREYEDANHPFMPNRVTRDKDHEFGYDNSDYSPNSRGDVYEKLYKDAEILSSRRHSRQRAMQRELQEMSKFSSLSFKHSGKKHISLINFRKFRS